MKRRDLLAGLPALTLVGPALLARSAAAAEVITMDHARRQALLALPSLSGPALSPDRLEDRPVVVTFFASWCPPCRPEFAHLKAIDEAYRARGVTVVALNIFEDFFGDDGGQRLKVFLAETAPDFTVLGEGGKVAQLFGAVERIPTVFVFDRVGQPTLHFIHAEGASKTHVTHEELVAAVETAL